MATNNMIAPNVGQTFSGMPSGTNYMADANGLITGVQGVDVPALLKANCTFQTGQAKVVVAASGAAYTLLFPAFGDIFYDVTLSANCTLSIGAASPADVPQIMTLLIRPNGFQATLPSTGAQLVNMGPNPPTPSTSQPSAYTYASDGTAPVIGEP